MLTVVLAHLLPESSIETTTPLKGLIEDPINELVMLVDLYPCWVLLVFALLTHNLRLLEGGNINMGFMQELIVVRENLTHGFCLCGGLIFNILFVRVSKDDGVGVGSKTNIKDIEDGLLE